MIAAAGYEETRGRIKKEIACVIVRERLAEMDVAGAMAITGRRNRVDNAERSIKNYSACERLLNRPRIKTKAAGWIWT